MESFKVLSLAKMSKLPESRTSWGVTEAPEEEGKVYVWWWVVWWRNQMFHKLTHNILY